MIILVMCIIYKFRIEKNNCKIYNNDHSLKDQTIKVYSQQNQDIREVICNTLCNNAYK